jgi:hypothetical protein
MDALQTYLKPEAIALLQQLAKENRPAEAYFTLLQVCALALKYAEDLGPGGTDQVDQVCADTVAAINAFLPDGMSEVSTLLMERLGGYATEDYFQRRQLVTERRKTSLLRRLAPHIPWMKPR